MMMYEVGPPTAGLIVAERTPKQPGCFRSGEPSITRLRFARKRDRRNRIERTMLFVPVVERGAKRF
jgi:hypothetical protein